MQATLASPQAVTGAWIGSLCRWLGARLESRERKMWPRMSPKESSSSAAERELVARAGSGEREAYDILVRLHYAVVLRLIVSVVAEPELARDLAQETFVRAWRALPRWRGEASFGAWVGAIARNAALDALRQTARRPLLLSLEANTDLITEELPLCAAIAGELEQDLRAALLSLRPELRAVFEARVLRGTDYALLASQRGVAEQTLRLQVMEARRLLHARLESHWREGDRK